MVLPLLRALVGKLEDKYFYYIFVLAIVYNGIVPCVECLWNQGSIVLSGNIKASWVVSYIVLYPCLGYFMHHRLDRKRIRKMLPVVWAADILSIAVSCYMTYYKSVITGVLNENESQGFFGIYVVEVCNKRIESIICERI